MQNLDLQNFKDIYFRLISQCEKPSRYIAEELGVKAYANESFKFCMAYPDVYELGQTNQAVRILINCANTLNDVYAERAYLACADFAQKLRTYNIPLASLETCTPICSFQVVGITLSYELCATNVLEFLDLSHIPLHATNRSEDDPIVIAGGPCALNPEPYSLFFDAFNIGEGEVMLTRGLEVLYQCKKRGLSRNDSLKELAKVAGWYVPKFYTWAKNQEEANANKSWLTPKEEIFPTKIKRQIFEDFHVTSAYEPCIVPFVSLEHDRLNVEVLRGCARGCRFCQAGMMYRPVRERSKENIVESVICGLKETGYDEVGLTSLSTTDHSQIKEIIASLKEKLGDDSIRISIPSQRIDSFGVELANLVSGKKKGGLTFAPEAGSQRLRDVINKNITEENIYAALLESANAGYTRAKLYFMIGLPTETDEDVLAIASLVKGLLAYVRKEGTSKNAQYFSVSISIALFVPKPHTPFHFAGQIAPVEAQRRVDLVRNALKKTGVKVSWHDPKTSILEAAISRAGRQACAWIESAWQHGAKSDAWSDKFNFEAWELAAKETGFDFRNEAQKEIQFCDVLPWSHIDIGISEKFFQKEYKKSLEEKTTPDCTYSACSGCGVCGKGGVENKLAKERV